MIKGVNKQVLEITEIQNGFFEKAIFFVKPEYSGMSEGKLKETARMEVAKAGRPPMNKYNKKSLLRRSGLYFLCIVFGVCVGLTFSALL